MMTLMMINTCVPLIHHMPSYTCSLHILMPMRAPMMSPMLFEHMHASKPPPAQLHLQLDHGDPYADTYADPYDDSYADPYADSYDDSYADAYADANADAYADDNDDDYADAYACSFC